MALDTDLRYVEQQQEATPSDVLLIKRWRNIAAIKRCNRAKQSKITSFLFKLIHSYVNKGDLLV